MDNKKFRFFFLFGILIIAGGYVSYLFYQSSKLFDDGVVSNAYIYKINKAGIKTGNIVIFFYFDVNGKKVYAAEDSNLKLSVNEKLLNSYFPLIYDTANPKHCLLLTTQDQWKRIGLGMPDSLFWIKEYYP